VVDTAAANNNFEAGFSTMLMHKDVGLALDGAKTQGVTLSAAELVYSRLQQLIDDGNGDLDCSAIIGLVDENAEGLPQD